MNYEKEVVEEKPKEKVKKEKKIEVTKIVEDDNFWD